MPVIVQVDFPFQGPFGAAMAEQLRELADSISKEPGFIWKIWTENEAAKESGGIYMFADRPSAEAYLAKHTARLQGMGMTDIRGKVFEINETLSKVNNAPLGKDRGCVLQ